MTDSPAIPLPPPKARRRLREAASLTQAQLAARVGVTRETVRAWETGRTTPRGRKREAYAKQLARLAREASPAKRTPDNGATPSPTPPTSPTPPMSPTAPTAPTAVDIDAEVAVVGLDTPRATVLTKSEKPEGTAAGAADPAAGPSEDGAPRPEPGEGAVSGPGPASGEGAAESTTAAASTTAATAVPNSTAAAAGAAAATRAAAAEDASVVGSAEDGAGDGADPAAGAQAGAATAQDGPAALTPAAAYDALYTFCAPALVRQTYLLTGRCALARESVERAFQLAWDRWPEVARDRDPAGWVRAAAYEYALSPWHRLRLRHRRPEPPAPDAAGRVLLDALLKLPPSHRRTLLLYDGVGLDLPETAAETEASTPAAANRLLSAREAVATRLPELADPTELHRRLAELASTARLRAADPPTVRKGSERRARLLTRAAIAFTAALIGTTALTLRTAPTKYEPPVPAGETVRGVPPRVAPGALSDEEIELRGKLREELQDGPERLVPQSR
ncbi:helix-turn-helix domain-containing protein [Streptomyces sp. CRN 30]|uniref:helix-turn-helix domain-containing protein n=1 Tax=Streptomyces sp. CRN 30 TaxID=3075613 RepID=UPI002A815D31|nr:helix-turn-helix domain-containing protein [Streptomyces sp. CRN 30]